MSVIICCDPDNAEFLSSGEIVPLWVLNAKPVVVLIHVHDEALVYVHVAADVKITEQVKITFYPSVALTFASVFAVAQAMMS